MTSYFDHMSRIPAVEKDTIEFTMPVKVIEHVDSSTIVERPTNREDFLNAYHEAVRRQNNG